jgi:hypothetical protein
MQEDDAALAKKVVIFAKKFSSEAFYTFDDPLEAAFYSVIISMVREQETAVTREPGGNAGHSGHAVEKDTREPL